MLSILIPSRGFIFSETVEAVADIMKNFNNTRLFISYNLPIPDSHNSLVKRGLEDRTTHLLFIEEDVVPPKGILEKMLEVNKDIVFVDYGVNGWSCSARDKKTNEILWAGLGATLIKREVFETLKYPWFRTDKTLRLNDWQWLDKKAKYGGHDIWFYQQAIQAGFKVRQVEGEARHLKLKMLGVSEYNNGFHLIEEKPKINKQQFIDVYGGSAIS